jgi:hypothetical protein
MSGVIEGVIGLIVIAGGLRLTWSAAKGAARATGAAATAIASVVCDERRRHDLRRSVDAGSSAAQASWQASRRRAGSRRDYHAQRQADLSAATRATLDRHREQSRVERERLERDFQERHRRHQDAFEKRCDAVEDDIRHAEEKFDARLEQLRGSVDARFATERSRWSQEIAAERARADHAIESQRASLQSQIDELQRRVDTAAAAADEWLRAAAVEVDCISSNVRHEFFCPGELNTIEDRLALARRNHTQGIHQAAVALAQESALAAADLHERLELLSDRWEAARALAIASLTAGIGAFDAMKTVALSDVVLDEENGPTRTVPGREIDVDHWTEGAWSTRRTALADALARIDAESATADLDELDRLQADGETAVAEAEALVATAKYAALASIMRAELQERFAHRLADAGYTVEDNVWAGGDERDENHLFLRGVTGDQISIVLSPTRDGGAIGNALQVNFHDPSSIPNEAEREERARALSQVLGDVYDLPVEQVSIPCAPGTEHEPNAPAERFDVEAVRRSRRRAPHAQPR